MNQYFLVKKLRNADEACVYYRCPESTMSLYFFFFTFIIFSGLDLMCAHTFILHNQRGSEN